MLRCNYWYQIKLISYLSWTDIKARYARSILGPFWLVLTTLISVVGLGYVWSTLFDIEKSIFIPFLSVGLVVWQLLSTAVIEATTVYSANSGVMRNTNNPLLVFPFAMLARNCIVFAHNIVVLLLVYFFYPPHFTFYTLLVIPGFILVIINMAWLVTLVAILGARYRDIGPAITSFMTILFFLCPIMYKPEQLGIKSYLLWYNPFSYMITVIRDPLAGVAAPLFIYLTLIVMSLIGWLLVGTLMQSYQHRIIYWV